MQYVHNEYQLITGTKLTEISSLKLDVVKIKIVALIVTYLIIEHLY